MEARPEPARAESLRRAGQCRHRSRARAGKRRLERASGPGFLRKEGKCSADRRRSRSAARHGVVDAFGSAGLRIFGPTRAAAQLESSKDFAKSFMARHGIPTARHASFERAADAKAYVVEHGAPIVVKADGLAGGKGVVVAGTREEAHAAIDMMLTDQRLGAAGSRVVVEEFLEGEEASFIVMSDGAHVLTLATSQDHKRLRDGDAGPNTGGMGAYSPAPVVTPKVHSRVMREIILPTIAGMDANGEPRTIEFNCRLGDPEAQVLMLRLKSDLFDVLMHATGVTPDATLDGL